MISRSTVETRKATASAACCNSGFARKTHDLGPPTIRERPACFRSCRRCTNAEHRQESRSLVAANIPSESSQHERTLHSQRMSICGLGCAIGRIAPSQASSTMPYLCTAGARSNRRNMLWPARTGETCHTIGLVPNASDTCGTRWRSKTVSRFDFSMGSLRQN